MKKRIKLLSSISLFLVLSAPVWALAANGDEEVVKKKTISKTYNVSSEDKLEIENSFGNIVVNIWDKNEIAVDIEIGAKASSEARAQGIMDELDVKETHSGNIIGFKTKVGEIHGGDGHHRDENDENRSFYVDYVIHMPAGNRMELENSFGKLTVPDIEAECSLTSKFGSLTAGRLHNVNSIDVEFGRADIAEIRNGKAVFKFDKLAHVAKISGNAKLTTEFSHNVQFSIGNAIDECYVYESYSDVRVVVPEDLSAEFNVHTSFGSFHNDTDFKIREEREGENDYGPHFDKDYTGKAGDGKAHIRIKSSFGSVRLSHTPGSDKDNDGDDEDDKGKNKHKNKNKDKDKDNDDDDTTTT